MSAETERHSGYVRGVLADTPLFGGVAADTQEAVLAGMERVTVHGGETLFRQGEEGDALYLVLSGRLRVELRRGGEDDVIREVARGETVGELALLTGRPRSATVRAMRDTELARLSRDRFQRMLVEHPQTAIQLTRMLADWVTTSNAATGVEPGVTTVAVIPGSRAAPVHEVTRALTQALSAEGSTLHLTAATMDQRLWPGAGQAREDERVIRWLDEQERTHTFVLYEGEADHSPWTRRCLRQADRILRVVKAGDAPVEDPAETASGQWAMEELVFVHPFDTRTPADTARWLMGRPRGRHHHVRAGYVDDYARLARRLTGSSVGIVLSGGGARGFAHLGVLRAIQELGIPVDQIGGTSMGAVIAAQYAAGHTYEEMLALNRKGWQGFKPHKDYTLPYVSLVTERKAEKMLRMMFGDARIEDFWLDCFAVSTNLTRAELMVHRRGPAVDALLASIAIPGVAPPIIDGNGDLLIDGGVLDNLPLTNLPRQAAGLTIAVNASPTVDMEADRAYRSTPSVWRVLANRLKPFGTRHWFPNIFEILARTAIVASAREARRAAEAADLYLKPPTDRWKLFDMHRLEEIADAGYAYAHPRLAAWWAERGDPVKRRRSTRVPV